LEGDEILCCVVDRGRMSRLKFIMASLEYDKWLVGRKPSVTAATVRPHLPGVVATDVWGRPQYLKTFYYDSHTGTDILRFHDSHHILPALVEAGLISSRRIICLSFGWFLLSDVLETLRQTMEKVSALAPPNTRLSEQLLIVG
jgi:hypothetical protein